MADRGLLARSEVPPEPEPLDEALEGGAPASSLDRVFEQVAASPSPTPANAPARLALLRGLRFSGADELEVEVRGGGALTAEIAEELDRELLGDAIRDGQLLLAEWPDRGRPLVVGVVQSRPPSRFRVSAEEIALDASRELVLRSGGAALRLRSSGEVELVGSRISAVSRGVMRLIGRLLRLN